VTPEPSKAAVRAARMSSQQLGRVLDEQLGSTDHPQGAAYDAIRSARLDLAQVGPSGGFRIVGDLRRTLSLIGLAAIPDAIRIGQQAANQQAELAGLTGASVLLPFTGTLIEGWNTAVEGFLRPIDAMLAVPVEMDLLIGDGSHLGFLQPAPFTREGSNWLAWTFWAAFLAWLFGRRGVPTDSNLWKTAVPVLDLVTTDCCKRVAEHPTIRIHEVFELKGSPRFADRMQLPPFHWRCRTTVALSVGG
jgi:hypothetical protein